MYQSLSKMMVALTLYTIIPIMVLGNSDFNALLVPTDKNSLLYYEIGGGSGFVLPPVRSTDRIRLNAGAAYGSGYECSVFNPATSLTNSLNRQVEKLKATKYAVAQNATNAISHYPMYMLARANPSLYNAVNNQLLEADNQVSLATKTCEQLKQETARGLNPYHEWAEVGVNNAWKKRLGLAAGRDNKTMGATDAKEAVDENAHKEGLPWVAGNTDHDTGLKMAGGYNQPPIEVIKDTTKAGYNTLLGCNPDQDSCVSSFDGHVPLKHYFSSPLAASHWVTSVLGDTKITTCIPDNHNECEKGTIPGKGLSTFIHVCENDNDYYCAKNIATHLGELVTQIDEIESHDLAPIASTGFTLTPQSIKVLREYSSTEQTLLIEKIAQEIAVQKLVDKAIMARRLLLTGSRVPAIATNEPAQKEIKQSVKQLDDEIQQLAFEQNLRKQIGATTMATLLQHHHGKLQDSRQTPQFDDEVPSMMEDGAISK